MNKIQKFIENNSLEISGTLSDGSNFNFDCCILSGYALHLDMDFNELRDEVGVSNIGDIDELERVFDFAEGANYGDFWVTTEAKDLYVF